MGVQLVDLKKDRRTVIIPICIGQVPETGEDLMADLNVTYRPSGYTANTELEFNAMLEGKWKSEMGLEFLLRLLIEWDLEEDEDVPYPLEKAALGDLPSDFITQVIRGVSEDMGKARARSNGS